ncbi:MAG TPA: hypothetical protein VHV77_17380, partial [Pirellulales bacterium]|nr:hypothetical protein [Pirellulales bacterium]
MTTSSAESPQAITADARRSPRKRRSPFWTLLSLLLVLGVGLSAAGFKRYHLKRLEAVRKDVLYRCAQPTEWGLRYLINHCAVKTIVSLQLFDSQLYRGCLDPWGPSGVKESQFVPSLGARLVQWPMGEEACWPWPTPWQLEAFLGLMDDPENLPVAVHCQGGRHRTGTVTAIYRMEYDRWPADRAIAEMHSFDFPEIVPIQEHNLRTYLPRPRPDAQTWATMAKAFESVMDAPLPSTYEQFVRSLRRIAQRHSVQERVSNYLERQQPFALPLAARLIDEPDDPLVRPTMIAALKTLRSFLATRGDWQMAASVIADFGSPENQRELFAALSQGAREATVSVRYAALV